MSGFIEIYKIDPEKVKENLYPKLIDSELEEVFIPGTERRIGISSSFLKSIKIILIIRMFLMKRLFRN